MLTSSTIIRTSISPVFLSSRVELPNKIIAFTKEPNSLYACLANSYAISIFSFLYFPIFGEPFFSISNFIFTPLDYILFHLLLNFITILK